MAYLSPRRCVIARVFLQKPDAHLAAEVKRLVGIEEETLAKLSLSEIADSNS